MKKRPIHIKVTSYRRLQARYSLVGELWGNFTQKSVIFTQKETCKSCLGQLWLPQSFLEQLFSGQLKLRGDQSRNLAVHSNNNSNPAYRLLHQGCQSKHSGASPAHVDSHPDEVRGSLCSLVVSRCASAFPGLAHECNARHPGATVGRTPKPTAFGEYGREYVT